MSTTKYKTLVMFACCTVLAGIVIYSQGLSGPWLFDDYPNLLDNPFVQIIGGDTVDDWRVAAVSSSSGPLRRPVSMLSFAANHAVNGGFFPLAVKGANLLIHCFIGLLVFLLARLILDSLDASAERTRLRTLAALLTATIWFAHPLHVSTVLYSIQRMAQLSTLFVLLGLVVFVRYRKAWARRGATSGEVLAALLWLLAITGVAVLSKENGALLPWLVIVVEVAIFRGCWNGRTVELLSRLGWLLLVLPLALLVMVLLIYPDALIAGYAGREFNLEQRLLTQGRMLWQYLGWLCLPNINDMGMHHDDIPWSTGWLQPYTTLLSVLAWVAILTLSICLRQRLPLLLFAVLFYLVGHSMESGVLPLEMVFEHRSYLPIFGVCLLVAWLVVTVASASRRVSLAFIYLAISLILLTFLYIRVMTWSDEMRLAQVNMINHPASLRASHMYTNALMQRYLDAEQHGLSQEDKKELIIRARSQYEQLHERENISMATLVMLYQIDSLHFPELAEREDWLSSIERKLQSVVLHPTDIAALSALVECLAAGACRSSESPAAVERIVQLLRQRFAGWPQVDLLEYDYLVATDSAVEERIAILERGVAVHPSSTRYYYLLIEEYSRINDLAGVYEAARSVMLADPRRRELPVLRNLFSTEAVAQP